MKKLMPVIMFLAIMALFPALGFAKPLTMDEALEGVCRVTTAGSAGS